jgi:hypothetical protein
MRYNDFGIDFKYFIVNEHTEVSSYCQYCRFQPIPHMRYIPRESSQSYTSTQAKVAF